MKGKKFYVLLVGILLIGLSTIYFFRQKQKEQILEFEAYEIEHIEDNVDGLYNEDKTDISENISAEKLDRIEALLQELKVKDYSPTNEERLERVETEFLIAKEMDKLQLSIGDLFIETGIVERSITVNEVENLEEQITNFQEKNVYYERNLTALEDAKEQVEDIKVAIDFIDGLFDGELVRMDVTRENEEQALKLIEKIKNKEIQEELFVRAEVVNIALTEAEEILALEEALAEEAAQQALEEVEEQYESSDSNTTNWNSDYSESWNNSENTGITWTPESIQQENEAPPMNQEGSSTGEDSISDSEESGTDNSSGQTDNNGE